MTFHTFSGVPDMMAYAQGEQNHYFPGHTPEHMQSNAIVIDPRLNQAKAGSSQMERYLMEANKILFNPARPQSTRDAAYHAHHSDFIAHLPPGSVGRHGSPISQQNSPGSSGAQSPPTESDMCQDGTQGPSTPPDMALMSPYMAPMSYDYLDNQMQFPFNGLMHDGGCVNPSEIQPVHNLPMDHHDNSETPIDFNTDMGFSVDDTNSPHYSDAAMFIQAVMPPQALSEAGAHVKKTHDQYPDVHDMVQDLKAEDENIGMSHIPCEDDGEFIPSARPVSGAASAPRRSRRASTTSSQKKPRQFKNTSSSAPRAKPKAITATAHSLKVCLHCNTPFKDETALQKHTKQQHTRPFTCVFHYAGCSSTFATKNEWKRHVASQHLALNYWLCTADSCAKSTGPSTQQRSASLPSHGAIFNRKDLYTQHVRRMHAPPSARKAIKNKKPTIDWDERLRTMQESAKMDRCALPNYMLCPAPGCGHVSNGPTAWDDRMEHVARHLERAAVGEEPPVSFGGYEDPTLTEWAESVGVEVAKRTARGWELCNPLKGEGNSRKTSSAEVVSEEDAEGEYC